MADGIMEGTSKPSRKPRTPLGMLSSNAQNQQFAAVATSGFVVELGTKMLQPITHEYDSANGEDTDQENWAVIGAGLLRHHYKAVSAGDLTALNEAADVDPELDTEPEASEAELPVSNTGAAKSKKKSKKPTFSEKTTQAKSVENDRYARGLSPDGNDSDFNKSEDYDGIIDFHEKPKKVGRPLGRLSEDKYAPRVKYLKGEEKKQRKTALRHARVAKQTPEQKRAHNDKLNQERAERSQAKVEEDRAKHRAWWTNNRFDERRIRLQNAREDAKEKRGDAYSIQLYVPELDMSPPFIVTSLTTTTTTTTTEWTDDVSVIVFCRFSWWKEAAKIQWAKQSNIVVLNKFVADFLPHQNLIGTLSVVWNGREAHTPLPWAAGPQLQLGANYENEQMDNDLVRFLESRPAGSKVVLLNRGIDGSSIDPGSFLYLQRFQHLEMILAFSVAEIFVRMRQGQAFFTRTAVYDQRLYGFWTLSQLTDYLRGYTQDPKSTWLVQEWRLGRVYRQAISMAQQLGDPVAIGAAQTQFKSLYTGGRNEVPVVPLQINNNGN